MDKQKKSFKDKIFSEITEYLINFVYMSLVFSVIILYRRQVLASHGIHVSDYFMGVFKAFVIAKVVMIGAFLKISHWFEHRPLFIPILYKAFLFTLMVMVFDLAEGYIFSLIHDFNLGNAFLDLQKRISAVWFSGSLLVFVTFIPFFAIKELIRVMGKESVIAILLERRKN